MPRYVALLRGINVSGKRKILMKDLRTLCENNNLKNVETYIQSGNVFFTSASKAQNLEKKIKKMILDSYGFDVPVIVRTKEEMKEVVNSNPFLNEVGDAIERLYVTFLGQSPELEKVDLFNKLSFNKDKFQIEKSHVYINYETKASQSKLTNNLLESKLKVSCTSRNWKTTLKILEMLS